MALDGYDVIRELGRGGMAVVHLARQRDLGRLAALKELLGLNAGDPSTAERFLRESRVAGSLNHANIVTVYEYFEDGGTPYISMELMEGGSLRPLIGELSLPKVARVLEDLLAAIDYAGKAGIVHRDLKPENALLTKDGRVKVADFGIAKAAASTGQKGLTSEGMTVGTPEYMSPEQALAGEVGPPSDLYAVGCMTYEMLTGRLPFTGGSQASLLMRHVNDPVPDVREVDPLIPESVADWVAKMTAKDPDERFQSGADAWESFEEAVLDHIGPLWRRDAAIVPGSAIDLDDIPEQTATPLRPPTRPSAVPIGGSVTGFQTYQAPAALHEQLAGEGDGGAAVATPPPTPAAPAPRRVTPPPQRTAPVPVATVGAPKAPERPVDAEPEPEAGPPIGKIMAGAVVALVAAFAFGIASGGGKSLASVSGDGFVLQGPAGWSPSGATPDKALGAKAVALTPAGAAAADSISAARLTSEQVATIGAAGGDATPVKLQAGEGLRVGDSVYVLPTDAGNVVVSCGSGPAAVEACPAVAGSLKLTRGTAQPAGPTDDGATAITAALNNLRAGVRNPTADLRRATSARAQGTAARDLARAYRTAASAVSRASVGAAATPARDDLVGALRAASNGWTRYAGAASAGNAGAAANAARAVSRARTRVTAAQSALAKAGYKGAGG